MFVETTFIGFASNITKQLKTFISTLIFNEIQLKGEC